MKLIPIKKLILLVVGCSLISFIFNPFDKEADFVGQYTIQTYPIEDGIKREVVLSSNSEGYQQTFFDGCSQSDMKFSWRFEAGKLTFYGAETRLRSSCDEKWPVWDNENIGLSDPFEYKIIDNKTLLLVSEHDTEYKELWIKTK